MPTPQCRFSDVECGVQSAAEIRVFSRSSLRFSAGAPGEKTREKWEYQLCSNKSSIRKCRPLAWQERKTPQNALRIRHRWKWVRHFRRSHGWFKFWWPSAAPFSTLFLTFFVFPSFRQGSLFSFFLKFFVSAGLPLVRGSHV